ncbi:DUF3618 domain-containing protein [Streptomyces katrae]|uniref:DUF3618 domain-containing protein n=1 Tax=Streptomyces katrae TaxID=68223 RepID=A0ABT7GYA2_9ACTN|nr:DUF3618 domain-containing protein [Streptomyces katrae]MDK9498611.1 DUF3618 domain-containing protein [Streptomyces katrae]
MEHTRDQLGRTVEALATKADVKAQAKVRAALLTPAAALAAFLLLRRHPRHRWKAEIPHARLESPPSLPAPNPPAGGDAESAPTRQSSRSLLARRPPSRRGQGRTRTGTRQR